MLATLFVHQTATTTTVVQLDTVAIATLVSFFIPLLVSLVTKHTASDGLRAITNIVATAIVAVVTLFATPHTGAITWQVCVNTFIAALVASLAGYHGVWKPTGVSGSVTSATRNFGLGSPPVLETPNKGAEDLGQVTNDPKG